MSTAATVESTPPRQPADHAARRRPAARIARRRLVDERRHRPVAGAAADAEGEVAQDRRCRARCARPRDGTAARRSRGPVLPWPRPARWRWSPATEKPGGARGDEVAVARPDPQLGRHVRRSSGACVVGDVGTERVAVLALRRRRDRAAERVGHQLHAVADAEHRARRVRRAPRSQRGAPGFARRCVGPPERMMPAGPLRAIVVERRVERQDLAVDRELAQPPRDELRELRAEVEDEDGLMCHWASR